jgi:hypothetical protein
MSDAERDSVLARLQTATAEGRLTLPEFSSRAERVYACRTWGEVAGLLDDLPAPPGQAAGPPAPPQRHGQALLALVCGVLGLLSIVALPLGMVFGAVGVTLGVVTMRDPGGRTPRLRMVAASAVICGSAAVAVQVSLLLLLGLSWS